MVGLARPGLWHHGSADPVCLQCQAHQGRRRADESFRFGRFLERNAEALHGRVTTYDPYQSGSGLLFFAQDVEITSDTWNLVTAIGRTNPKLLATSSMLDGITSGRIMFADNVLGAYAMARQENEDVLGVVIPSDYVIPGFSDRVRAGGGAAA